MPKIARGERLEIIAYEYMKEKIISGEYPAGYRIIESKLSEELNMSRTPIRRAIVSLAHAGFVKHQYNRGAFVENTQVDTAAFFSRMKLIELLINESVDKLVLRENYIEVDDLIEKAEKIIRCANENSRKGMIESFEEFVSLLIGKINNDYFNRLVQDLWIELDDHATEEITIIFISASSQLCCELKSVIKYLKMKDYSKLKGASARMMNAMLLTVF
ncbi:GntR family transcriptional regulator [Listeria costaricensis]|uniref:GntR family transcriptional regulator n=1 Tax=Listeria costaricensis TaxID=2026604 RepID=UPI000C08494D|nr:GntR family transcriptional regulator [Listeria costaricensis]